MKDRNEIESAFGVLGLDKTATLQDVKEAHRFLVQTFHEDKYPAGSSMREKAKEKMIALNNAYELLREFFEEFPGGFVDYDAAEEEQKSDWQNWREEQDETEGNDIREFQKQEKLRREKIIHDEEKVKRQTMFNFILIGAWLLVPVMFPAHDFAGSEHRFTRMEDVNYYAEKLNYARATGTATEVDVLDLKKAKERWNAAADQNNQSLVTLYVYLAGLLYVTFAPRSRRCIGIWLETGEFSNQWGRDSSSKGSDAKTGDTADGEVKSSSAEPNVASAGADVEAEAKKREAEESVARDIADSGAESMSSDGSAGKRAA